MFYSWAKDAPHLKQIVSQALLGRPDAYVAGIVKTNKLVHGEALADVPDKHLIGFSLNNNGVEPPSRF